MSRKSHTVTWAEACRDVLLRAISSGQLVTLLLLLSLLVLCFKIEYSNSLLTKIIDNLVNFNLVGWILFFMTIFLWYVSSRKLRKMHSQELERVGLEKTKLQSRLYGNDFKSSDN